MKESSRTTTARPARAFMDSEEYGHCPHQRTTLHGDIFGS